MFGYFNLAKNQLEKPKMPFSQIDFFGFVSLIVFFKTWLAN